MDPGYELGRELDNADILMRQARMILIVKRRTYYETGSKSVFICAIETSESSYPSQFEFSCLAHVSL